MMESDQPTPASFGRSTTRAAYRAINRFPLRCALCGAQMRLIAFVTDLLAVKTILGHLGEPTTPPCPHPQPLPQRG